MPRYIDADALKQRILNNWYTVTEIVDDIDEQPTADEEKIATEYCMKRCLVMITMDTYEKLIACYNRCAGLRDERSDDGEIH